VSAVNDAGESPPSNMVAIDKTIIPKLPAYTTSFHNHNIVYNHIQKNQTLKIKFSNFSVNSSNFSAQPNLNLPWRLYAEKLKEDYLKFKFFSDGAGLPARIS
jgi:hypothetical protein